MCLEGAVLAEYKLSEATEPKKADCLGGAVFTCSRNSPVVFLNVLFMGVTVWTCVTMRLVGTVCGRVPTEIAYVP